MSMKSPAIVLLVYISISFVCCQSRQDFPVDTSEEVNVRIYQPSADLGDLFHEIQIAGIFPDSKTLVDSKPLVEPELIISNYHSLQNQELFDLRTFVNDNFDLPVIPDLGELPSEQDMFQHLSALWPILTRQPDFNQGVSSLLPLPHSYVVPGGRFREIYYWDSYFTMLGLMENQKDSLVLDMIRNFAFLIDTYGFIPNGNRSYYLGRSQPPFFSAMVMLWADHHGLDQALQFLPQMRLEYEFWMKGAESLSEENTQSLRTVLLPDGHILNRYWDNYARPRPESYREDVELVQAFPENKQKEVYRNIRSGAESGWDYSSRWFSDGESLDSIITTQILPVDLNCLMYFMELSIAKLSRHSGNPETADEFQAKYQTRAKAIRKYFWDTQTGYFTDHNLRNRRTTLQFSAAGMTPLFFQIATEEQAQKSALYIQENLLLPGGIVSTTKDTGQQWDYPNGWAPQQWIAVQGLRNYQNHKLADDISDRWLALTQQVFDNTGKMMEKYNVADLSLKAGGGEYPTQDGFGWTNGVTIALNAYGQNQAQ